MPLGYEGTLMLLSICPLGIRGDDGHTLLVIIHHFYYSAQIYHMNNTTKIYLILLDIRSVHNVGAIFRTADAVGIDKVYLVGTTPTPLDRFGRVRSDLHKSALGAELMVPWEQVVDVDNLLQKLKKEKVDLVAIEQSSRSMDYKKYTLPKDKNVAIIIGTEASGIPQKVLLECNSILEIPMRGKKESLNVTTALGIALFRILNI